MMKKRLIFTLLLAAFIVACFAQKPYKVMFYNLENFFDTINDRGARRRVHPRMARSISVSSATSARTFVRTL